MSLILSGTDGLSDVDGTAATPAIRGTDTNTGIFFPAADTIAFSEGGTEVARFDSSGNLGIGTASPTDKLTITHADEKGITFKSTGTDGTAAAQLFFEDTNGGTGGVLRFDHDVNSFTFATAGSTERMRIDSSGRLLIATTSAIDSSYTLNLAVATANGFITQPTTNKTYNAAGFRNSSNSEVGFISCTASATSYGTSSDYRLKENIAPMTNALDKVALLKPVTYRWKATGEDSQGFIAHELQEVVPDCVIGEKDGVQLVDIKDEEGKVIGQEEKPVYQGIDTSFLVATLTAAIQELKAELDTVKAELATLKGAV